MVDTPIAGYTTNMVVPPIMENWGGYHPMTSGGGTTFSRTSR